MTNDIILGSVFLVVLVSPMVIGRVGEWWEQEKKQRAHERSRMDLIRRLQEVGDGN
jgi:hypothetical protein